MAVWYFSDPKRLKMSDIKSLCVVVVSFYLSCFPGGLVVQGENKEALCVSRPPIEMREAPWESCWERWSEEEEEGENK